MNKLLKMLIIDIFIDDQLHREFHEVEDYFDIFPHLNKLEKDYKKDIKSAKNAWFNVYEQPAIITYNYDNNEWLVVDKAKIVFFKDVLIKGQIDATLRDTQIIGKYDHNEVYIVN